MLYSSDLHLGLIVQDREGLRKTANDREGLRVIAGDRIHWVCSNWIVIGCSTPYLCHPLAALADGIVKWKMN
jgi:hypothetical protein